MTFIFTHKNSSAVLSISSDTDVNAEKEFETLVTKPSQWRMEESDEE